MNEIRKLTIEANNLMDATNLSDPSDLGGDNKMANTPAEIYENIRNKTLEEAALIAKEYGYRCISTNNWQEGADAADDIAAYIRELKTRPE